MIIELITISVSSIILFLIYFARLKSTNGDTFLFSERFLNRADEAIFGFIKFIYKMNALLFHNISGFVAHIPHRTIHVIHGISHSITEYTSNLVEKITHKNTK